MPDIPIWYYPIALLLVTLSIIAVRITAKFDFNKWSQHRHERRAEQVNRLCTHTDVERLSSGQFYVSSRMVSPPGTILWTCSGCGFTTGDQGFAETACNYW